VVRMGQSAVACKIMSGPWYGHKSREIVYVRF
jgi:hypothetical protein